ncbi:MAG: DUF87 domain-containing protein, partial [Candidatus Aenigmatarchaeota archaeon]
LAFYLASIPQLSNASVNPLVGGWGETFTFSVRLTDLDRNQNNVTLWKSYDNQSWIYVTSKLVTPTYAGYLVSFVVTFDCEDLLNGPLVYFKFSSKDQFGYYNESGIINVTFEQNDASLSIIEYNSSVRRLENNISYFLLRVYDSDRKVYPNNTEVTLYITENGNDYTVEIINQTYLGNVSFYYDPTCSSNVGIQKWYAKITDVCYKNVNTTERALTVIGQLYIDILNPKNNQILNRNTTYYFNSSVYDDCNLIIDNANVSWFFGNTRIGNTYNITYTIPFNYKLGLENVKANTSRIYYDPNEKIINAYVYGFADLTEIYPQTNSEFLAGEIVNLVCRVMDKNLNVPIEGYTVYFYRNDTLIGSSLTNSSGYATFSWSTVNELAGFVEIKCRITNDDIKYYNASISEISSLIRIRRPITIREISVTPNEIYRNDTFSPNTVTISVRTYDSIIAATSNAIVYFYNETDLIGNCTPNSFGYCSITYNPPNETNVGIKYIYINATPTIEGRENSDTYITSFIAKGKLYIQILEPLNSSIFAKSSTVNIRTYVTSENGENIPALYPNSRVNITNSSSIIGFGYPTGEANIYAGSFNLLDQKTGWLNISTIINIPYYDSAVDSIWILVTGLAGVEFTFPSNNQEITYPSTIYPTCLVKDLDSEIGIENYPVEFYYKTSSSDWIYVSTEITNSSGLANISFTTPSKGEFYFKCVISDNATLVYSAIYNESVVRILVKDLTPPEILETSISPIYDIEANRDFVNISAVVSDNIGISEVWAMIGLPNGSSVRVNMNKISGNLTYGFYSAIYIPPIGGEYNVTVFAKDLPPETNVNSSFAGIFYVFGKTNLELNVFPENIIADGITIYNGYPFEIIINVSNLGPATAYDLNITLFDDSGRIEYSTNIITISNINRYINISQMIMARVKEATPAQTINIFVNLSWRNPDLTYNYTVKRIFVIVAENPKLEIKPEYINEVVEHDTIKIIGSVNITNIGNVPITEILLSTDLNTPFYMYCLNCSISLFPTYQGFLAMGQSFISEITVSIPAGQDPGSYWSRILVSSKEAATVYSIINITVPINNSWIIDKEISGIILAPLGTKKEIDKINFSNIGNVNVTISIYLSGRGAELVRVENRSSFSFVLPKQKERLVSFSYDIPKTKNEGLYDVRVVMVSTDGYPNLREFIFTLNVTDIPPIIENVTFSKTDFEINETINVTAKIYDNIELDKAWINISYPNNTYEIKLLKKLQDDIFYENISSRIAGEIKISICANDTKGLTSCTEEFIIRAHSKTILDVLSEKIVFENVTLRNSQTKTVILNLTNLGFARAFNVSIKGEDEIFDITLTNVSLILAREIIPVIVNITALNGTYSGNYSAKINITWINLDGSIESKISLIPIEVLPVHLIEIENKTEYIKNNEERIVNISLSAVGNVNETNITLICSANCELFEIDLNETIDNIALGETIEIPIRVFVPSDLESGEYMVELKAYNEFTSATGYLKIIVPINISWEIYPIYEEIESVQGEELFRNITIRNTGNLRLLLNLSSIAINGSNFIYFENDKNFTTISLRVGETKIIPIKIVVPIVYDYSIFENRIVSLNFTTQSGLITKNSTFILKIHPLFVKIIEPTESNPLKRVVAGDTIYAKVNVSYGNKTLTSNVSFQIFLSNETYRHEIENFTAQFLVIEKLWLLTFIAPNLTEGIGYDLIVNATYLLKNVSKIDVEPKSIIYLDTIPPEIEIIIPARIRVNTSAIFWFNITDLGGVESANAIIIKPDSNISEYNLTFVKRIGSTYIYKLEFNETDQIGRYVINVIAYDKSGNKAEKSAIFDVRPLIFFSGIAKDEESIDYVPLNVTFELYPAGRYEMLYRIVPDEEGYYNETIEAMYYDIVYKFFNESLVISNIGLFDDVFNPIVLGIPREVILPREAIKGYVLDSILKSPSTLIFDISNLDARKHDLRLLGIYHCANWTRYIGCNSSWIRLNSIVSLQSLKVYATNISEIRGAYILAQYVCGNGICEDRFGESNAICPLDCPAGAPGIPAPGIGAPGIGAGVGIPAVPAAPGVGIGVGAGAPTITIPPYEIFTKEISVTLKPKEHIIVSVDIGNNRNKDIKVKFKLEGLIWEFVQLEANEIEIKASQRGTIKMKIFAPEEKMPGIYTGDLVVYIENETYRIPVTIKIELPPEPLLDVIINVLSKTIEPNETLKVFVRVVNMGQTEKVEDIVLTYTIKDLLTGELYNVYKETIAVETVTSFTREITLPEGIKLDRKYLIEVNASYWYGRKYAYAADTFEVVSLPIPLKILRSLLLNPVTYIVTFGIAPTAYLAQKALQAYKLRKLKEKRYALPIDFDKLPKAGPNSIEVGKIAETDVKAYFDMKQLIMHTIAAGGTGSGKTISAMVVAEELLKRNIPVIVFDPTAQWTGFIKPNKDPTMQAFYKQFGLKPEDARGFKTNIIVVEDVDMPLDIKKYMNPGEITVFVLNRLKADELDKFIRRSIEAVFEMKPPESKELKLLLIYDEIHRTLPKYGGKGGYIAIERGAREFRKWGIGLFLISQVLLDFKGAIRANVATEIQLRTKYEGDINRVKQKYGTDYASKVTKLTIGTGIVQNPEYNNGKPWIIQFRPILHSTFALSKEELDTYMNLRKKLEAFEKEVENLKARGIDTFDIENEIKLAWDRLKQGMFRMVETYIESIETNLKRYK